MTSRPPAPLGTCQDTAGFLFAHACPRPAHQRCARCARPICREHGHPVDTVCCCTACATTALRRTPPPKYPNRREAPDPYLYASHYYRHLGVALDPNDFTEADGASLGDAPAEAFERDMEGS